MTVVRPPVPPRFPQHLLRDGLALPYVNTRLADGTTDPVAMNPARFAQCWMEGLCQLDGQDIDADGGAVLIGGPDQLRDLVFDRPPLHPECAVYVTQACPVLGNRLPVLASGAPNHDWYAVYTREWTTVDRPDGSMWGAAVEPRHVSGVRLVSRPGVGRLWERVRNIHGLRVTLFEEYRAELLAAEAEQEATGG
jgi:hypothetical protein